MKRSPLARKTLLQSHTRLQSRTGLKRSPWKRHPSKANALYTKDLREYIKERDVYCRICGGRGDQVHHVIPSGRYKRHPEWYTITNVHDERNLMWICWLCHAVVTDNKHGELERAIEIQEARFGPLRIAS